MSSQFGRKLVRAVSGVALAVLVAGVAFPVPAAQAQGLFGAIFGALTGNTRSYSRSYAPSGYDDRFPIPEPQREHAADSGVRGTGTSCVRLCDGRRFPIPRAANGVALNAAKVCSSLCPSAKTQVFNGGNIAYATASDGTRYSDLPNAFAYRDKIVPDCSCTGHGPGGLAQIDIESDPTLRAGDVVAGSDGLTVFKGAANFPYKTADFTPIDSYAKVNGELRRKLASIKVDPTAKPATPIHQLAVAASDAEKPVAKPRRKIRTQAARAEEVPPRPLYGRWFR